MKILKHTSILLLLIFNFLLLTTPAKAVTTNTQEKTSFFTKIKKSVTKVVKKATKPFSTLTTGLGIASLLTFIVSFYIYHYVLEGSLMIFLLLFFSPPLFFTIIGVMGILVIITLLFLISLLIDLYK